MSSRIENTKKQTHQEIVQATIDALEAACDNVQIAKIKLTNASGSTEEHAGKSP